MKSNVNEVAKFLEHAVDELINGGGGTWYMPLNDYLDLDVGWMPGYGPEDWADGWDEAICAGIVVNDDMPDLYWATMPYADNGDVWDTCMALDCENEDYMSTAKWYLEQADEIMKAVESGEYKIPGYEPEDDDDDYYYESKRNGKKKVSEEYIKAPYEDEAKRFCTAIEKLANNKDALENFESYIAHHFQAWLDKWASTPEDIIYDFEWFSRI